MILYYFGFIGFLFFISLVCILIHFANSEKENIENKTSTDIKNETGTEHKTSSSFLCMVQFYLTDYERTSCSERIKSELKELNCKPLDYDERKRLEKEIIERNEQIKKKNILKIFDEIYF